MLHARDGCQALQLIRDSQPDVVLTDLRMPGMNGLELVETVRTEFPLLPVVLMTSQGNELIAVKALKAGASSYVPKKELSSELAETIQQVLNLAAAKRSERELFKFLTHCETRFELDNNPALISHLVGYFLNNLERIGFGDDVVRTQVGIALIEALSNAVIHGNLEVGSDLRKDKREEFDRLIDQRRREQPYCGRRVLCTARETTSRVEYVIADEGPGFNPGRLPDPTMPQNLLRVSGRGVMLIRTFIDEAEYNDRGNQLTMIKTIVPAIAG